MGDINKILKAVNGGLTGFNIGNVAGAAQLSNYLESNNIPQIGLVGAAVGGVVGGFAGGRGGGSGGGGSGVPTILVPLPHDLLGVLLYATLRPLGFQVVDEGDKFAVGNGPVCYLKSSFS